MAVFIGFQTAWGATRFFLIHTRDPRARLYEYQYEPLGTNTIKFLPRVLPYGTDDTSGTGTRNNRNLQEYIRKATFSNFATA